MEVVRREFSWDTDSLAVYRAVDADVLLENGVRGWRETYVAADPVDRFRHRVGDGDGLDKLGEWLSGFPRVDSEAGAIGFVGYDVARELEDVGQDTRRDIGLPDIAFNRYDWVVKVRADSVEVEAVAPDMDEARERIAGVAERLRNASREPSGDPVEAWGFSSNFTREEYHQAVETVKGYVRRGETFQANISQRLSFGSSASPLEVYAALRRTNPAPYMALFELDDQAVVSSSPELLVRKEGSRVTTRPIAGTRPRASDGDRDGALQRELRASEKERAEHAMLVDLARNDVGKVSRYGSVEVESYMEAVPYAEVHHLESVVSGELRSESGVVDVVRAMFPGGTVTGAPKPRTLRVIEEVEPTARGPYTGSLGRISYGGDLTLNILIRTMVRDGVDHHLQVGGGVVHDSDPGMEYRETLHKAEGVLNALDVGVDDLERQLEAR